MKGKKIKLLTILSACALSISCAAIVVAHSRNTKLNKVEAGYVLTLNSSTTTGLSSEYGNGTFDTDTPIGNTVQFAYKNGKASAGNLIELGKGQKGNPNGTDYYVGNLNPITSVTSIVINFESDTTMFFYVSADGTEFHKLEVLTASSTVTVGNDFFYFKFVNANQDGKSLTISSIVFNYECNSADYTDEKSDLTSGAIINAGDTAAAAVSVDTTKYSDGNNSQQSLKITAPTNEVVDDSGSMYRYGFSLPLERTYTVAEIKNMYISFSYNTEDDAAYDGSHAYWRLYIYISTSGYSQIKDSASKSVELKSANLTAGASGWGTQTLNFADATYIGNLDESLEINYFYFRPCYVNGSVNVDQMRYGFVNSYPEYASDNLFRAEHITDLNASLTAQNVDGTTYGDGVKIRASSAVTEYTRIFSLDLGETYSLINSKAAGATYSFYYHLQGATYDGTNFKKTLNMQFLNGNANTENRACEEFRLDAAGNIVTATMVDNVNLWVHVVVDVSKVNALNTDSFDRINFKIGGSGYLSLGAAEYIEFADFQYSNFAA